MHTKSKNFFILALILCTKISYADPICEAAQGHWAGVLDMTSIQKNITCHWPIDLTAQVQGSAILFNGVVKDGWSPNRTKCIGSPATIVGSCNNGTLNVSFTQASAEFTGAVINNFIALSGKSTISDGSYSLNLQR